MKRVLVFLHSDRRFCFFHILLSILDEEIKNGNEIYILGCDGGFKDCKLNRGSAELPGCLSCKKNQDFYINLLKIPSQNFIKVKNNTQFFTDLPEEIQTPKDLMEFELNGIKIGSGIASNIISELRDHNFPVKANKKRIVNYLQATASTYHTIKEASEQIKFDKAYVFNGRFAQERTFYNFCMNNNIDIFTFELGLQTIDSYRMFKNTIPHGIKNITEEMEELWEKGEEDKEKIASDFYTMKINRINPGNKAEGDLTRWYAFAREQKQGLLPENFDENKTNIAVFSSSLDEYITIEGWDNHIYRDEIEGLYQIFESFKDNDKYHFYLRIHPNLKNLDNTQIREIRKIIENGQYKNVDVIWPEDTIDTYALIDSCDKTITFGSSTGAEASFLGKPSILAGKAFYYGVDCCYTPQSHQEVVQLIQKDDLPPKDKTGALKYSYWYMRKTIKCKNLTIGDFDTSQIPPYSIVVNLSKLDKLRLFFLLLKNQFTYICGK